MINLNFAAPPADLVSYISGYYLFSTDEADYRDNDRADIAQFRVILSGAGEYRNSDGSPSTHYPTMIIGARTAAAPFTLNGPATMFGVGLLPAGWAGITHLPAGDHVNKIIDAATIFGDAMHELGQKLCALADVSTMGEHLNPLWRARLAGSPAIPHWFIRAVDNWIEASISPDIEALEASTGLSRRQIERYARQIYGSPPKLLARKYRALRTASAIAHGKGDWQDFIDDAYYDQSHCIREIKEFLGITPSAIRDHHSRLTTLTLAPPQSMARMPALSAMT